MKVFQLIAFVALCSFLSIPAQAVHPVKAPTEEMAKEDMKDAAKKYKEEWNQLSKKEKRAKRKEMRKELKTAIKDAKKVEASDDLLLLVIVTILLPPLGMALYDGITNRFWLSLLLTLLFYVPGLIYTLVVILSGR
ncbi:MAG: hypothetical protein DHS20C18_38330 [Saprospiraceae bacterium]|nr:MAG: hypothetical protein DHS20C18_38330 [Saprospiraceae bacterium]